MRKAEIVQRIAQELGCTTTKAETAVEAILTTIKASLQQGDLPCRGNPVANSGEAEALPVVQG